MNAFEIIGRSVVGGVTIGLLMLLSDVIPSWIGKQWRQHSYRRAIRALPEGCYFNETPET